ncbi:GNAT family N-acetyltransferase [Qipengyuania sp. GH38]|uniref:GNAT family N-acetyltransferase n=1 Tax=Qipengyuania intermedia TaxID=2867244 RepID=UPI001C867979|nr:GNAT family N-acetyltransferase [Qipengyuania intermedia]MBX7514411.1 GNAT family N-acetyltransferase [Qipengyuania intermedia]
MTGWSIRLAKPDDAEDLPAIERAAGRLFLEVEGLSGVAGMHAITAEKQRAMIRKGHCLVAESEGRIVGFLSTEPHRRELHIREFSVLPAMQGQGIGAVLLRAIGVDALNSGFAALTLTTFIDVPWNAPFYARLGFETVEDFEAHPRLAAEIEQEVAHGLPRERRCAMIRFLG